MSEPDLVLLDGCSWHGVTLPGERSRTLLAALALHPRGLGDASLVAQIWGDEPPDRATKALQVLVSRVRSATAPEVVQRTATGYRLGDVDADAAQLAKLARDAEADVDTAPRQAVLAARAVLGLNVGTVPDDPGPAAELVAVAELTQRRCRAVLGRALAGSGEHAEAYPLLCDAHGDEPDDEAVLVALLRAEAATRGAPAALTRYESYRRGLRDRLGHDPGPALRAVHAELLARDRPVRTNIGYAADRLIGRDDDVLAVAASVRTARLTTILGAGGLGKTRLARAVARGAEQPVVHFVELAAASSPEGLMLEVAAALGVRESLTTRRLTEPGARRDLVGRMLQRVGEVPTLLVLDNCEHLVDPAADLVATLLRSAPRLHVLTTSRAPLGLAAERVYPLPELSAADAVELFGQRAVAARPGVRLEPAQVAELVARLDGLPLAVELAAAKVRVMAVAEITRRLTDRFALLRGGSRDSPERHQTLLAVIDWSWNLLGDDARRALARLSVFRDGFDLTGAAEVIGVDDAVDAVSVLADQSLLVVTELDLGVRYRMLETVREFARLRLARSGDAAATEQRLRRWARRLAGPAWERAFGPDQVAALAELRAEAGNLTDVMVHALADGDRESAVILGAALSGLWGIEGAHTATATFAAQLGRAAVAGPPLPPELGNAERASLAASVSSTLITGAELPPGVAERLHELGPGTAPPHLRGTVSVLLAFLGAEPDDLEQVLTGLLGSADPAVVRLAGGWAGQVYENGGDVPAAIRAVRTAAAIELPGEGPWGRALLQGQLARLAAQQGDDEEAHRNAEAALPALRAVGAVDDAAEVQALVAIAAIREGRLAEAEAWLDDIEATVPVDSLLAGGMAVLTGRAELELARGNVDAGLRRYRDAIDLVAGGGNAWWPSAESLRPWVMLPQSAAVCASVRVGRRAEAGGLLAGLAERAHIALTTAIWPDLDFPVVGCALHAFGVWQLADPDPDPALVDVAVELLAVAERFSYNRTLPSLRPEHSRQLAEQQRPGALAEALRRLDATQPAALRATAAGLLQQVRPTVETQS